MIKASRVARETGRTQKTLTDRCVEVIAPLGSLSGEERREAVVVSRRP
jgi:hypothetical protein